MTTVEGELLPQPDAEDIRLEKVLNALGDPVRLHLFRAFATDEQCDCDGARLGLGHLHKSTLSHHMRVLREAGVTSTRAVGRNRHVALRRADLDARFPGLVDALLAAGGEGGGAADTGAGGEAGAGAGGAG
ncbi:helix-turn-helix transcriptional regulator [Streptomyces mobaraensis NBRC 13819 = DSM 40847]|uniref:ArsR/SmtB family transcription factor n=1 Tax=Streptomyces mobaraensis TaxID=35621 RepID=UPI00191C4081|nr:helix-turn-helix domain-containing protein [Streptomyces mobaraensis]QTT75186.1 helix-turn-helix transcriptional regulator [Streptomyces mobaraensis NBRC 13819 = DSM 40847]